MPEASPRQARRPSARTLVFGAIVVHLAGAAWCVLVARFDPLNTQGLADLWQLAPLHALRTELWRTVWSLSSQPPLYNLLVGAVVKVAPARPEAVVYAVNVALGLALVGMTAYVTLVLTRSKVATAVIALLVALNPDLVLFEAYPSYDLLTAFHVVLVVFLLARFKETQRPATLVGWVGACAALVLTRGMYHAALMLLALAGAWALCPRTWRTTRALVLGLALVPFGWYAKNQAQYGFFGASSWTGFYLAKVAFYRRPAPELQRLVTDGHAAPIVGAYGSHYPLMKHPERYRPFGYTTRSASPEPRADDPNLIDVSRDFGRAAIYLIRQQPGRYFAAALESYWMYSVPPGDSRWLDANGETIAGWRRLYSRVVQGSVLASWSRRLTGRERIPSFAWFMLPLWGVAAAVHLARALRHRTGAQRRAYLRDQSVLIACWLLITYSALTSMFFESGENNRYALYCEAITMVVMAAWVTRTLNERRPSARVPAEVGQLGGAEVQVGPQV